jgi:hypothetical protein
MLESIPADLARIALVAASYPLTIANSIATCLWSNPVDATPQAPTCTALRYDRVDFTPAYNSCGPPGIQKDHCCDVLLAIGGLLWYERINRTGLMNYEVGRVCCLK